MVGRGVDVAEFACQELDQQPQTNGQASHQTAHDNDQDKKLCAFVGCHRQDAGIRVACLDLKQAATGAGRLLTEHNR